MAEDCSVQVGIRIRPFNSREKGLGATCCIETEGPQTIAHDLSPPEEGKGPKEPKKFTFDASFWSFDGFVEEPNGYMSPAPGSKYADQKIVFDMFGKRVLDNAWEGYHCCLFAYGQTGAGKSYSMVGYGANRGIVPLACEEIFNRIAANTDEGLQYEVMTSMVEIYNEAVQDLLLKPNLRPKKGLDIRESQQLGIYIEGVIRKAVDTYKAIEAVVEEGTENRSVGSTLMNATSSRAHTVLTIEFKQVSKAAGATGTKISMINLVDLAGSEKAGQTGASGDRLKEGCAINKSLSALGNVIEKLADKASGKAKKTDIIPYRDSKLTRLLQNALGGSSKTVMICAISPASSNYEETLSTLRYADRAKRIKNSATVNENPQDKLIRQLREENANLKNLFSGAGQMQANGASEEEMRLKAAEISALEDALREMQTGFQEKLAKAKEDAAKEQAAKAKAKKKLDLPHIANLNEDELLTNKIQYAFMDGPTTVGKVSDEEEGPDIELAGISMQKDHATVTNTGGICLLTCPSPAAAAATFVNGKNPPKDGTSVSLKHGDRVVFGQAIFVFIDPKVGTAKKVLNTVSFASARKELCDMGGEVSGASEEELAENRRKAEELERLAKEAEAARHAAELKAAQDLKQREEEYNTQMEKLKGDWEAKLRDQAAGQAAAAEQTKAHASELDRLKRDFEQRQREAEEAAQRRIEELERKAAKAAAEEEDHRQHEMNMRKLEEQLMLVMPLVKEANLIATELQRPQRLETRMQVELSGEKSRGTIRVTAAVLQDSVRLYEWAPETLENRVFLLRELLQRCEEEGLEVSNGMQKEEDPLWDPVEVERLIGVAQVLLEGLLLQVENQLDARILSTDGHQSGTLRVELWPVAKDGSPGIPDEEVVDDPEELLGTSMSILLKVPSANNLPEALANDVRVEFDYFIDAKPHQISKVEGHSRSPEFNYERRFVQDPVTSRFLEYLKTKALVFRVFGRDLQAEQKHQALQASKPEVPAVPELEPLVEEPATRPIPQALDDPQPEAPGIVPSPEPDPPEFSPMAMGSPAKAAETPKGAAPDIPTLSQVRREQEKAGEALDRAASDKPPKSKSKACTIL